VEAVFQKFLLIFLANSDNYAPTVSLRSQIYFNCRPCNGRFPALTTQRNSVVIATERMVMVLQTSPTVPDSDEIVELLLHQASKEDLRRLVDHAAAASGKPVGATSFEPGDEICPTWRFPYPFPPRFIDFLQEVTKFSGTVKVFPLGVPNPEEIIIQTRFAISR